IELLRRCGAGEREQNEERQPTCHENSSRKRARRWRRSHRTKTPAPPLLQSSPCNAGGKAIGSPPQSRASRPRKTGGGAMRHSFVVLAAASIAAVLSGPAAAQNRPPIETTKVEGTDNVYIFRNVNHQSMFIVTNDGVIATDPIAYGRPTGGQAYVDEIRKVTDKPIK